MADKKLSEMEYKKMEKAYFMNDKALIGDGTRKAFGVIAIIVGIYLLATGMINTPPLPSSVLNSTTPNIFLPHAVNYTVYFNELKTNQTFMTTEAFKSFTFAPAVQSFIIYLLGDILFVFGLLVAIFKPYKHSPKKMRIIVGAMRVDGYSKERILAFFKERDERAYQYKNGIRETEE